MTVLAVLSDVHGNLPALKAVLADAEARGVDGIVVAGDLSGFGGDPDAVTDILRGRGAAMIRGNHERDYVAPYDTPARPAWWEHSIRLVTMRQNMDRLGPDRRAYLAALPDRISLDGDALIVHGSPRDAREGLLPGTTDEQIRERYAAETCALVFCGHTHRPLIRDLPELRLVNVGSVGLPLNGDTRASYAIAARGADCDGWRVELIAVEYDVEAALASKRRLSGPNGLPELDEVYARTLRTGRDYWGPMMRATNDVDDDLYVAALRAYLAANP
jgi:predicted phosphodiesterase